MPKGRPSCRDCSGREYHAEAGPCPRCADVRAQAADWLAAHCPYLYRDPGNAQDSHAELFRAACITVGGFGLDESAALGVLRDYTASSSDAPWSEHELTHKVRQALKASGGEERGRMIWTPWGAGGGAAKARARADAERAAAERAALEGPPPEPPQKARPFDRAKLRAEGCGCAVDREWLAARSVCAPSAVTPEFFLSSLYQPGERILVFTRFESQGQYLWVVPGGEGAAGRQSGAWELGRLRGDKAKRVARLPREGPCGVWFLNQPVSGQWLEKTGYRRAGEAPEYSRRHEPCVTRWPYMVLETDEKGIEAEWLSMLAGLPLPITALYTSGGKSVHALVSVPAVSKREWDYVRDQLKPWLTERGADPGVFSAVRLTRLPGTIRHGTEKPGPDKKKIYERFKQPAPQELLYFNPKVTDHIRIADIPGRATAPSLS